MPDKTHVRDTGSRESTTGLGPEGLHGHPRLVRGVASRTALGKAREGLAPYD
jgi:hypothetical protein